jgi:hypothetical protein
MRTTLEIGIGLALFIVMLTESLTAHSADGTINFCWVRRAFDAEEKYIGTHPCDWIARNDCPSVRRALKSAAAGQIVTVRYSLRPSLYDGKSWRVETVWMPFPSSETPILGWSRTYTAALDKLTKSERLLIKAIAQSEIVGSAALQGISSSAVRAARSKLAKKLGISPAELAPWCSALADLV